MWRFSIPNTDEDTYHFQFTCTGKSALRKIYRIELKKKRRKEWARDRAYNEKERRMSKTRHKEKQENAMKLTEKFTTFK